jgi:hypothetical protein
MTATALHVVTTAEATVAHAAMTEAQEVHAATVRLTLQSRTTSQRCSKTSLTSNSLRASEKRHNAALLRSPQFFYQHAHWSPHPKLYKSLRLKRKRKICMR